MQEEETLLTKAEILTTDLLGNEVIQIRDRMLGNPARVLSLKGWLGTNQRHKSKIMETISWF